MFLLPIAFCLCVFFFLCFSPVCFSTSLFRVCHGELCTLFFIYFFFFLAKQQRTTPNSTFHFLFAIVVFFTSPFSHTLYHSVCLFPLCRNHIIIIYPPPYASYSVDRKRRRSDPHPTLSVFIYTTVYTCVCVVCVSIYADKSHFPLFRHIVERERRSNWIRVRSGWRWGVLVQAKK